VIKSSIEQRDAALEMGVTGATALLFRDSIFVRPASSQDSLKKEQEVRGMLAEKLKPKEGDAIKIKIIIIIGSADKNEKTAELTAKNAALLTIFSHDKHH
jgi:hypothetical protein